MLFERDDVMSDHPVRLATLREDLAGLYQELSDRGLNVGIAGSVSCRTSRGMLITPNSVRTDTVVPADFVELAMEGRYTGRLEPSGEWPIHAAIYHNTPAAMVVVHMHGDHATALACLGLPLPAFHYAVLEFGGDEVRCAPYAPLGSPELAQSVVEAIAGRTACLLANHGMICHGRTPRTALDTALRLDNLARQYLLARAAGTPRLLTAEEVVVARARSRAHGQQPGQDMA
jgi:L-fuculose-phosphate aldolase